MDFLDASLSGVFDNTNAPAPTSPREQVIQAHSQLVDATVSMATLIAETQFKLRGKGRSKTIRSISSAQQLQTIHASQLARWESLASLVQTALDKIATSLLECDDAFDALLELKTHQLILQILPAQPDAIPDASADALSFSILTFFNIITENMHKDYILFLLFSNNYINEVISFRGFGFRRKSATPPSSLRLDTFNYYVTLLKNLSNKLNSNSIHFFFNEHLEDFPLFVEALALFESEERMNRIAARTVTLNVFKVNNASVVEYIVEIHKSLEKIATYWAMECVGVENLLLTRDPKRIPEIENAIDDCVDTILYFQDVFNLNISILSTSLCQALLKGPIARFLKKATPQTITSNNAESTHLSFFMIAQVFNHCSYTPLLDSLVEALFSTDSPSRREVAAILSPKEWTRGFLASEGNAQSAITQSDASVSGVLLLMAAVVNSGHISGNVLANCGLHANILNKIPETLTTHSSALSNLASPSAASIPAPMLQNNATESKRSQVHDSFLIDALIEILGSVQTANLRPICLELVKFTLETIFDMGNHGNQPLILSTDHAARLQNSNSEWSSMILSLINDGVEIAMDLLEYEVCQPYTDLPRNVLKNNAMLLRKSIDASIMRNGAVVMEQQNMSFQKQVRNIGFIVQMWLLTSHLLDKFGLKPLCLPALAQIECGRVLLKEGRLELDGQTVQECIIYQGNHAPVNGLHIHDAKMFLLAEPDKLRPGKARILFETRITDIVPVLAENEPDTLHVYLQPLAFADNLRARLMRGMSLSGGYQMVWQDEKKLEEVKLVFRRRSGEGVRDAEYRYLDVLKEETQARRKKMWMEALK
ncbi:Protein CL16A [Chytriomyces hyalinus]|nr:Protein CL16A [Chytriomyces hyalinus]